MKYILIILSMLALLHIDYSTQIVYREEFIVELKQAKLTKKQKRMKAAKIRYGNGKRRKR